MPFNPNNAKINGQFNHTSHAQLIKHLTDDTRTAYLGVRMPPAAQDALRHLTAYLGYAHRHLAAAHQDPNPSTLKEGEKALQKAKLYHAELKGLGHTRPFQSEHLLALQDSLQQLTRPEEKATSPLTGNLTPEILAEWQNLPYPQTPNGLGHQVTSHIREAATHLTKPGGPYQTYMAAIHTRIAQAILRHLPAMQHIHARLAVTALTQHLAGPYDHPYVLSAANILNENAAGKTLAQVYALLAGHQHSLKNQDDGTAQQYLTALTRLKDAALTPQVSPSGTWMAAQHQIRESLKTLLPDVPDLPAPPEPPADQPHPAEPWIELLRANPHAETPESCVALLLDALNSLKDASIDPQNETAHLVNAQEVFEEAQDAYGEDPCGLTSDIFKATQDLLKKPTGTPQAAAVASTPPPQQPTHPVFTHPARKPTPPKTNPIQQHLQAATELKRLGYPQYAATHLVHAALLATQEALSQQNPQQAQQHLSTARRAAQNHPELMGHVLGAEHAVRTQDPQAITCPDGPPSLHATHQQHQQVCEQGMQRPEHRQAWRQLARAHQHLATALNPTVPLPERMAAMQQASSHLLDFTEDHPSPPGMIVRQYQHARTGLMAAQHSLKDPGGRPLT